MGGDAVNTSASRFSVVSLPASFLTLASALLFPIESLAQEGGRFEARFEPTAFTAGQPVTVRLSVTQYATGTGVELSDTAPVGWAISGVTGSGTVAGSTVRWVLALGPGLSTELSYRATPPAGAADPETFTGVATFSSDTTAVVAPRERVIVPANQACTLNVAARATPSSGGSPLVVELSHSASAGQECSGSPAVVWSFGDGSPTSAEAAPTHTYAAQGEYTWTLTVTLAGTSETRSGTVVVTAPPVVPPLAGPWPRAWIVVTSAHKPGLAGTRWVTDLTIHNPASEDEAADIYFLAEGQDNRGAPGRRVVVGGGQSARLTDVVDSTFGIRNKAGALLVTAAHPLLVSSRTYNDAIAGSFGQYVPGIPLEKAYAQGDSIWLPQLTRTAGFRTNIGFVNAGGTPASVSCVVRRSLGGRLGTRTVNVSPFGYFQATDLLGDLGGLQEADAFAQVSTSSPAARILAYASVVDNRTGDPVCVLPVARGIAGPEDALYLPAAAHLRGALGTNWRTDVGLLNTGSATAQLEVALLPRDQTNLQPRTVPVLVPAGQSTRSLDALASLFAFEGAAALRVGVDQGTVMATARTFNDQPVGSFGQFIPGEPASEGLDFGQTARLLLLARSADARQGFRSNIGFTNLTGAAAVVELGMFGSGGSPLGSRSLQLPPFSFRQMDDALGQVTASTVEGGYAVVGTTTPGGRFLAYASVIDNRSGDPIYVTASPTDTVGTRPITLDNRANALLVDRLPATAGISALPAGVFTASVSGSGNLGREDLPLHVACLYKNPSGELRAVALPLGGKVDDVGGGSPLRCFVPDWYGTADNQGSARVRLESASTVLDIDLDARRNSVALDTLPQAVVVPLPARRYRVASSGNLGRPELAPQVLVLHKDAATGRFAATVVRDGEVLPAVLPASRVVAVVLDWISRDDNTGETVLTPEASPP